MPDSGPKMREVADDALEAIRPILAKIRDGDGEFPDGFWQDPFVLGFIGSMIGGRSALSRSERGFLLPHVYSALSDLDGTEIARIYAEHRSAVPRHADFANGCENAAVCMRASVEGVNASGLPQLDDAKRLAAARGLPNDEEVVIEILYENLFYGPLRKRFSFDTGAAELSDVKSEAVGQEMAVVVALPTSKERLRKRDQRPAYFDPSEFEEASRQIAALEAQIRELRRRGDNWQKAGEAAALAQQQLPALKADIEKLRRERDSSVSKAHAAQAAFNDTSQRLAAVEADLATLREERDDSENEAQAARAAADEARHGSIALSTELDRLRDERDSLIEKAEVAEAEVAEVREHASELGAELERLRSERDNWIAKAEALEVNLETLREARDDWQNEARAARAAADDVRQVSMALSTELEKLEGERHRLMAKAEAAEATVVEVRRHASELEAEFDELSSERDRWVAKAKAGQQALKDRAADARARRRRNFFVTIILFAVFVSLIAYLAILQFGSP